jgi:probable phosphoglycerate mutase
MAEKHLQIHFLRHGQTALSRDNMFCGSGTDVPLTEIGHQMAQQFASVYGSLKWQAIYCSPQTRAMQTASYTAKATGQEVIIREALREIAYGDWEGKTTEEVDKDYHDDYVKWTADPAWNRPTGGGELAVEISDRVMGVIQEIRSCYDSGRVLVVAHKATIRVALCQLLGIDVGRFRFRLACAVAGMSVVEFGDHGPYLKVLSERSHLSDDLRNLPGT